MGNVTLALEDARDAWTIRTIDSVRQDVRDSLRGLSARAPASHSPSSARWRSASAPTPALFSIFNSLILRPLPVREPGQPRDADRRVVALSRVGGDSGRGRPSCSTAPSRGRLQSLRPLAGRPRRARRRRIRKRTDSSMSSGCTPCAAACSRRQTTAAPRRMARSRSSAIASGAALRRRQRRRRTRD